MAVKLDRRAHLLDAAVLEHHDAVGQRHGLDLIVRDIDHGRVGHGVLELGDLDAGGHAQGGVEIGKRLVEQEDLGVAHDGAADGHALALAAGERLGQAVEILLQLQDRCGLPHALVDLGLFQARDAHAEGHVFIDRHMRIERIGLEHHGNATLRRRHAVHQRAADAQFARRDLLQPGDRAQQGGLAAA